jgi:hypothetical protein
VQFVGGSKTPMLSVVPDNNYPNMWRIRTKDGLSDMANLTRIRDAAATIARAELDAQTAGRETLGSPARPLSKGRSYENEIIDNVAARSTRGVH